MKAVTISKNGGPEVLELKDIKLDDPKSGEVLIKNEAIGLNYIDTYHRSGLYPIELPSGIGIEGAGIIEKVGPDVNDFSVGDKAAYASMPIGSYATHRIFPTKKLVKVPNEIELENVVTLMTKGFTVFYLLHKTYPVKSGETILFHAAAGGVGNWCVQLAKLAGNHVIGTCSSEEKATELKRLGCDRVIVYTKENLGEVLSSEYPDGINLIFEQVGTDTFDICVDNLATRGRILICGFISEYMGDPQEVLAPRIYHKLLWKSAQVRAFLYKDWPEKVSSHIEELVQLVDNGKIDPLVDNTLFKGVDSCIDAVEYLHSGKNVGKVVVTLSLIHI